MLYADEAWAKITRNTVEIGLAPQEEWQRASNPRPQKRLRSPEPDLGEWSSWWMAKSKDRGGVDLPITRPTKRMRVAKEERETGDRAVAQRGETQELHAGRSPGNMKNISKLGNIGLGKETLVVPPQGLYTSSSLGITGETLGPAEFGVQAWTEKTHISEGTEDVQEKGETEKERFVRLMYREGGKWKCRECQGGTFFDKATLRRHCKTVHGNDEWACSLCPKIYGRSSNLRRHIKQKHQGGI